MAVAASVVDAGRVNLDKAYAYAEAVRSGEIVACRYVILAVERWFDDLENAHARGLYFSEEAAAEFFRFSDSYCRHYQGEFAGKVIEYAPWQAFGLANIFGWVREDGTRRFRIVYEDVARKNGKTTKLAAVGSYLAAGDYEPGAKVYCAATKRDQAREVFDSIAMMVKQDATLRQKMKPLRNVIHASTNNSPNSSVVLLSSDYDSMDGLNVHGALVDELHAHKDSGLWDVLESARGARLQPLMWGITTAGKDQNGFCYELRSYVIKVLEGSIPAEQCDHIFGIIFTLDEDDDWLDEKNWIKSNPNLGVSVSLSDMREQCQKAKEMPTARVEFMTKRLNVWVYSDATWMNMEKWNACRVESFSEIDCWRDGESSLYTLDCYGGIDLASVEDLTSFALDFKVDGKHVFICRSYLPQLAFDKRIQKGGTLKGLYQRFVDEGFLVITPGEVCDYSYIKRDILASCERFNVKEIGFDRFNSSQLVSDLLFQSVPMVAMGQGVGSINAPMKEMLRIVLAGEVVHNNSLLSFAMSNLVANVNAAGDIKYDKSKVSEKIDPAVAAIMALGRSTVYEYDNTEAVNDFLENPIKI